jgi:hypothetical protein
MASTLRGGEGMVGQGRSRIDALRLKMPRSRRGTMPDSSKDKRGKQQSQLEQDAQTLHEKTARLREMRLAHEAATGVVKPAPQSRPAARKPAKSGASKSKSGKSKDRGSLADWLTTQENQGRRS